MDMKTIYTKILAAALAVLPFTSCVKEKIEPGEPENDSYGVYFETLTSAQKSVELEPSDAHSLSFKAYRTKEDDAIVVPVTVTATCDGEAVEGVFSVSEIFFDDGQTETEFQVSFPEAEVGKTYSCTVECTSWDYVKIYSPNPTGFTFEVVVAKWTLVTAKDGSDTGTWRDDILSVFILDDAYIGASNYKQRNAVKENVKIYEKEGSDGIYRVTGVYDETYCKQIFTDEFASSLKYTERSFTINATNPAKVYFEGLQYLGVDLGAGEVRFLPGLGTYFSGYTDTYGTMENGVIKFPYGSILYHNGAKGWYYGVYDDMLRIELPGCKDTDYTLDVAADYTTQDGKLPVQFTLGADVKKVVYDVYEGEISSLDLYTKVLEVVKNPDAAVVTESGTVELELEETGVYTIVAAAVTEGDTPEVLNYVSEVATYVAPADAEDKAVVLTVGIELTSSYAGAGHDKTNSALGYIYGKDLTDVRWGVFKTADIDDKTLDKVKSIGDAAVEKANNGGYSYLFTKLAALTDYTLVVWATNGYSETVKMARITTDGLANVLIGKGTYTYDTGFVEDEEGNAYVDEGLEIFRNPNVDDTYVIEHWCNNVDFSFTYDNATGKAHVATQETGYTYSGYPIYVVEYEDYMKLAGASEDDIAENTVVSSYDEASHTFKFAVAYIVIIDGKVGRFAAGYEPYVTDEAYPDFTPTAADTPATTASFSALTPFGFAGNLDAALIVKSGAHFGGFEVNEKVNRTVGFTAVKSDRKIEKPFLRLELAE